MSRVVDERVVEMRFNNSNFERNAKATMSTVEKLKQKLNFSSVEKNLDSLEKTTRKFDMSGLSKAVETVSVKFNALQIAGITALQRITNQAIDTGERLVKSLSVDQITEGFSKYEQKTAAVQTIMNATGKTIDEVSHSLEKLNWFTDETSYNFVDMVNNIGKFTSAGVDLDVAVTAMEGIANEAAISGQGINEASRAMYNFAQAIGVGSVKLIDWKSIENANMATKEFKENIIDVAISEGTLIKTSDGLIKTLGGSEVSVTNFSEALKDEWFTSDVLVKVLQRYGKYADDVYTVVTEQGIQAAEAMEIVSDGTQSLGERAFKAAQEAKTFTDAINATKDAVSTSWMTSFEIIFGNYEKAKDLWTELSGILWDIFASGGEARNELLTAAVGESNWDRFTASLNEAGIAEEQFGEAFKKTAKKYGLAIDEIIEREGSLEAAIKKFGWRSFVTETLDDMTEGVQVTTTKVADLTDKFEEYQDVVNRVIRGDFKNGVEARTKALAEAGYEFSVIQPLVNKQLEKGTITADDLAEVLGDLTEEELKNIGVTKEQADALKEMVDGLSKPSGRELLIDSMRNAFNGLIQVIGVAKEAWADIFPPLTAERIYALIEKVHDFSTRLVDNEEALGKIKRTLRGVFAALDIVRQVIWSLTQGGLKILGALFGKTGIDVAELSATLGDNVVAFRDWLNEGNKIQTFVESLVYSILKVKENVQTFVSEFSKNHPEISKWFEGLSDAFEKFKERVKKLDGISLDNIKKTFQAFRDTVIAYITDIDFNKAWDLNEWGTRLKGQFSNVFGVIVSAFSSFFESIKPYTEGVAGFFIGMGQFIKDFVKGLNPLLLVPIMFVGVIFSIRKLSEEIEKLYKMLKPLDEVKKAFIETLTKIGKSVGKYMEAKTWTRRSKALVNFALSVGILVAACWGLAQIPVDDLEIALKSIIALMATLTGAAVIINFLGGHGESLVKLQGFVGVLGIAILSVIAAMKLLQSMAETADDKTWDRMIKTVAGIAASLVVIVAILAGITKLAPQLVTGIGSLIGFAVAVDLITAALVVISKLDTSYLLDKILSLAVIMAGLILVTKYAGQVQFRNAVGIMGLVASVWLLIPTLKAIAEFDPIIVLRNLDSFVTIFGTLAVLAGISRLAGGKGLGGFNLLGLTTSLLVLIPVFKTFAEMSVGQIFKAGVAVSILLTIMALLVSSLSSVSKYSMRAGATILMIAGAVAGIALVIWGLSKLDQSQVWSATGVVDSILLLFAAIIGLSKLAENATKSIMWIMGTMTVMAALIALLTTLPNIDKVLYAAGGMALLMTSMAISLTLISKWKKPEAGAIKNLLALSGVVAILATILTIFEQINPEKAIAQAGALSILLGAMTICADLLSFFGDTGNDFYKAWITMGAMAAIMSVLALVMKQIKDLDPGTMAKQALALGLAVAELLAATAVIALLGKIPGLIEGALIGLAAFALVIVGLGSIFALIGALNMTMDAAYGTSLAETFDEAAVAMASLGRAVTSFVGGLIGGFAEGIASSLPQIGEYMSDFATNCQDFFDLLSEIKPDTVQSIDGIVNLVAKLADAAFTTAVGDFVSWWTGNKNSFDNLGNGLTSFGANLVTFANEAYMMEQVGTLGSLIAVTEITEKLVELLGLVPTRGGKFKEWFSSEQKWENLSDGLVSYGDALKAFGETVVAIKAGAIHNAIEPTKDLVTMLSSIPLTGGVWGEIFGGTLRWDNLSSGLAEYGQALVSYGGRVSLLTPPVITAIKNSVEATEALANVMPNIPAVGGKLQWFTGEHDWSTLSIGLGELGSALASFGKAMSDMKSSGDLLVAFSVVPLLDTFVDTMNEIANIQGLGLIDATLTPAAIRLGNAIGEFGDNIGGTDVRKNVQAGLAAADMLIEFDKKLRENRVAEGEHMTKLGKDIHRFANELVSSAKSLKTITNDDFYKIAMNVILGFVNGIDQNLGKVRGCMDRFVTAIRDPVTTALGIHSPSDWFEWVADMCNGGFGEQLEKGKQWISGIVSGWTDNVKQSLGIEDLTNMFSNMGLDLNSAFGEEFANGLNLDLNLGADMTSDYEKRIAEKKAELKALKKEYGETSDEVIKCQQELEALQDEYKSWQKSFDSNSEYVAQQRIQELRTEYDELLKQYKEGRLTQAQYDEQYFKMFEKYSENQVDLLQYSMEQMNTYVTERLTTIQETFEDKISDIQGKMDDFKDRMGGGYEGAYTFTTNKDIYDKKIDEYTDALDKLNDQLEESQKLYGENSIQARRYKKEIEQLEKEQKEYEKSYKESGVKDEDIVGVKLSESMDENADKYEEYTKLIQELQKKNVSQDMIDYLRQQDLATGMALAKYWAGLSDTELQVQQDKFNRERVAREQLANALYSPDIIEAEKQFVTDYTNTIATLPDSAKAIGYQAAQNMVNSFSEETNKSLTTVGESGDALISTIKAAFGITPDRPDTSTKMEDAGDTMANSTTHGFIEGMMTRAQTMAAAVKNVFSTFNQDAHDAGLTLGGELITAMWEALQNPEAYKPTISGITSSTLSTAQTLNAANSRNTAMKLNNSFSEQTANGSQSNNNGPTIQNNSFTQNINAPKTPNRTEIRRDTQNLFTLATSRK